MATFNYTTSDAAKLAGITSARLAHNAALPAPADGSPSPDLIATDQAYVQFVMDQAAASYAVEYKTGG